MANNCKNAHYKSAIEFYNTNPLDIEATTLIGNPITLPLGSIVTNTGCAIDTAGSGAEIEAGGLYRIKADVQLLGTTAGDVTVALALNGSILPETVRTVTLAAGGSLIVPTETVRRLITCCQMNDWSVSVVAYSDGTGAGTATWLSGNIVKLA